VTLTKTSNAYQFVNPNGSNRDVNLPSVTSGDTGLTFVVANTASSGSSVLVVKNSGGTQVGTNVPWGASLTVVYDGSAWRAL
jgi:urocanate hydratase